MATHGPETRRFANSPLVDTHGERHLRDLLKQLANDGGALLRNEISLAKLEMRDMAREISADSAKVGAALGIALAGALTLVAAATIALGNALNGNYALSALIIGTVMLIIGGVLARNGISGLRNGREPVQTKQSLQRDKEFVREELRDFKEGIRS